MRPQNIDYGVTAKLRKVIGADHRIVVVIPHLVDTRFKLNQVVDVRTFGGPVHPAANAAEWKLIVGVTAG